MPYGDREKQLAYWREYRARRKSHYSKQNQERYKIAKARYYRITVAHKRKHPCTDCGERRIEVLEFDHVDPKTKHKWVSHLMSSTERVLREEIAKCVIRCGPCHRRRTREQVFAGEIPGIYWWHITDDQAREIKKLYDKGGQSQQAIADLYGTCQTNVSQIVRGKRACIRDDEHTKNRIGG